MEEDELEETGSLYEHHKIEVDPGQQGLRIDKFLMDRLPHVTRTKIQSAIQESLIRVNDQAIKSSYKVHPGDVITVLFPHPPHDREIKPENIPLDIVFEDEHLLVVNKPAGMVVHPAHQNWEGTLVNALSYHFQQLPHAPGNEGRPGLVHRIDKNTSGLLVIAKTESAMSSLVEQFFNHTILRIYWALTWRVPHPQQGTIESNLGRNPKDRRIISIVPDGKPGKKAITHYKVLQDLRYVSLVECKLETGRTHQIRAHFQSVRCPLFNDIAYGGGEIVEGTVFSKYKQFVFNCFAEMPRQALHAKSLGFVHPHTHKFICFDSSLPHDFKEVLRRWENYVKYN